MELPVALISTLTLRLSTETEGLFDNVVSMIQLLTMSVNRAQDFIKISSDITLVPDLRSFVLMDVLKMVDKCIASQNSDRIVNTLPVVSAAATQHRVVLLSASFTRVFCLSVCMH